MSTFADRADIAVGIESGLSDTEIAEKIDRDRTVVWRERRRNSTKTRGYRPAQPIPTRSFPVNPPPTYRTKCETEVSPWPNGAKQLNV